MSKKRFLLISLFTAMMSSTCISVYAGSEPINIILQVGYEDPILGDDGLHRAPALIPNVSLDDHSLLFNTPCDGCVFRILDRNGVVVYTTIISPATTRLELPSHLLGEYQIQIILGNLYFYGNVIL